MNNLNANPVDTNFSDLEDASEWSNAAVVAPVADTEQEVALKQTFGASESKSTIAKYEERCKACRGSGDFISWAGRRIGPCFKCEGIGTRKFKTSPETRAKAKVSAEKRKQKLAADRVVRAESYRTRNAEVVAYLEEVSGWNSFAADMLATINEYGQLSEKQRAAVDKMHANHVAKQAAKAAEPTSGLDLTDIPAGLYAVPNGETRLKVAIRKPGEKSKWHGSIFVDDGAEYGNRQNYGRQLPGKDYEGQIIEQLQAIAKDPLAAMKAYGNLVGCCGACGRKLEDEKSIEMGIGPVCLKKFS